METNRPSLHSAWRPLRQSAAPACAPMKSPLTNMSPVQYRTHADETMV